METWKQLGLQVSLWGLVAPPSHLSFPWPHVPRDSRGLAVSDKADDVWPLEGWGENSLGLSGQLLPPAHLGIGSLAILIVCKVIWPTLFLENPCGSGLC